MATDCASTGNKLIVPFVVGNFSVLVAARIELYITVFCNYFTLLLSSLTTPSQSSLLQVEHWDWGEHYLMVIPPILHWWNVALPHNLPLACTPMQKEGCHRSKQGRGQKASKTPYQFTFLLHISAGGGVDVASILELNLSKTFANILVSDRTQP